MEHRQTAETSVRPGRGRPFSKEALEALCAAVASRSPAADWTRYRVLAMALTLMLLVWGAGRVTGLVLGAPDAGASGQAPVADASAEGGEGAADLGRADSGPRLRNDLFKVPEQRRAEQKQEPKTNPVELLNLIELQGVMGGDHPRAMIQYKRTKETVTVSVGDDLGEFKVTDIRVRSVVLKWRDELFELSL